MDSSYLSNGSRLPILVETEREKMIAGRNFTLFFDKIGHAVALGGNATSELSVASDARMGGGVQMGLRGDANLVDTFPGLPISRVCS